MGVGGLSLLLIFVALCGVVFAYNPSPSLETKIAYSLYVLVLICIYKWHGWMQMHISNVGRHWMRTSWATDSPITPKADQGKLDRVHLQYLYFIYTLFR